MYGAIFGDMIGAPYEFDRGKKTKDFPMFTEDSRFTDDTVMTIAVAEALLDITGPEMTLFDRPWWILCGNGAGSFPTRVTAAGLPAGSEQRIRSPMAAMETVPLCEYLPQAGCMRPSARPGESLV